jgi:hypothetical protein
MRQQRIPRVLRAGPKSRYIYDAVHGRKHAERLLKRLVRQRAEEQR